MNIAIIGTRGIPNHYGGFEQFAEYLSLGLVERGHKITVYNSHKHPYQEKTWNGVELIHCYDPEEKIGTAGQFVYDFNCILDSRNRKFDIILQLGYTSSSIWGWLLPRKISIVTTNVDGLEWKRTKFSPRVKKFLKYAERLGIKYSDYLISDSIGIQDYLKTTYNKDSLYIPYGAHLFKDPNQNSISKYDIAPYAYNMLVARLEPENSIEMILDGVVQAEQDEKFLVVGKHDTKFGIYLKEKFKRFNNICFVGGIYDINVLNNLRHFSNIYFHGHTVGGTNPSLLEAMASQSLIAANQNIFNESILGEDAFYFRSQDDVASLLQKVKKEDNLSLLRRNELKISNTFSWDNIINQYENHFSEILNNK
jgi:glycosyltransferase involved in cell wall biosynthesis